MLTPELKTAYEQHLVDKWAEYGQAVADSNLARRYPIEFDIKPTFEGFMRWLKQGYVGDY